VRKTIALATAFAVVALAGPAQGGPSDPHFSRQWGLSAIKAEQAWSVATGAGTLIAVVDSGVDLGHPDLSSKLVVHNDADFVEPAGNCTGNKKTGRTCIQDGPQDENGHGTHVAGIAAALTNNGVGVAGTAPDARILPVRVLDAQGVGSTGDVAAGIRYAAGKGADVINLSLGFLTGVGELNRLRGLLRPVYDAIDVAVSGGAVVVIAAGNDGAPVCAEPAAHPAVVCVGATDSRDLKTWYSNFDASTFKRYLVAPGGEGLFSCSQEILSTYLRGADTDCSPAPGYEATAGTSMAAPFVSGVAALLAGRGLGNGQIVSCLLQRADDLGVPGHDPIFGFGRLNALRAVNSC
jgi:subtilisin family serine protease